MKKVWLCRHHHHPATVNPAVFFNITVHGEPLDHVSFKLFADKVAKTAENFHALNTGDTGLRCKGSCFHRIIVGFMCQGGDFTGYNGTSGKSMCGVKSDDESFILKHMGPSILSMGNAGADTNCSQFFTCTAKTEWADGRPVVFGKVEEGMNIVEAMECFSPGMAEPPSSSLRLTTDNSNKFDLCFNFHTIPSIAQECTPPPSSAHSIL
ncbi:hypothetical protein DBR06_SOUSAS18310030 [Sousa chinensis]|nr:hypothetical protein DBR06_SOUSAS18310030 [Sousa chinensis]